MAKTGRKFPFAIHGASAASAGDLASEATWNLIVVFVYAFSWRSRAAYSGSTYSI